MTKKHNDLYKKIIDISNIEQAYKQTQKGSRKFRNDSIKFDMMRSKNIVELWRELKTGRYRPGEYIRFKIYEPKERMVSAPRIRDKIVQFAVHTVLKDVYMPVFISDSYACLEGRGTHRAVDMVQRYMRSCEGKYGDGWIVKVDVSKFFYSIDRDILKGILRKKISCRKTLWLLDHIIDSSPEGKCGIPLGNVTSQDFANVYLNELDQFVKRWLGVKWYVRYMDDAIAIVQTREDAKLLKENMIRFLEEQLNLQANPRKTQIFPLKNGVNAYGFKIWTTHRKVRDQSKRAMKRRIKAMDHKVRLGKMNKKDVQQAVNSWLGHARHSNSYSLARRIFRRYKYIRIEGNEYFGNRSNP